MTDKEVELVAELLAKVGGTWFPERARLARKPVTSRQRDVARLILAELERTQAAKQTAMSVSSSISKPSDDGDARIVTDENQFSAGRIVEYCPPGDKRTVPCWIEKSEPGRAYLIPVEREVGWVSTHTFLPLKS